jgi:hypothetical protein
MKKNIYIALIVVATALLGYTVYYIFTHTGTTQEAPVSVTPPPTATSTETVEDKNTLTTKTGKKIKVEETNPQGQSLSTIVITPSGFATNTPVTLETNKLTKFFLTDLNKDTFDELILITTADGSGSYGDATIYTTTQDQGLITVKIPVIQESDTKKGGLFEGYMGHDTFSMVNGMLMREFPLYNATDTNSTPTGGTRKVIYTLEEKDGVYSIAFTKVPAQATTTPATTSTSTTTATSTTKTPPLAATSTATSSTSPKGQ